MDEASKLASELKNEADKLLASTGLFDLLKKYGVVELGGSYSYNLMVDRDLDFGVAVSGITPQLRSDIAKTFAEQTWAYSVNMTDRVNFEPLSNLGAPRGLYLGLTIPYPMERWNIDVWFIVAESLEKDDMTKLVESATVDQKNTILQIKYELLERGLKQKGITSSEVYSAVIRDNITTITDFLNRT